MYLISSLSASKIKKTVIKVIKSTSATPFHKGVANHPPGLPFATSTGYHNLSNIATWFAMGFWSYPDIDILHNPVYNKSSKRLPSKTAGPSLCVLLKSDFSNPTSNHHLAEWWLLTFLCIWSALWALPKSKKLWLRSSNPQAPPPFHKGVANHPPGLPFATSIEYHNLSDFATKTGFQRESGHWHPAQSGI